MDRFQLLVARTRAEYDDHILGNPLLKLLAQGGVTHAHYVAYLVQTYHLVRHTARCLALAAARLGDERRALRAWFLEQANDEHGHELFCLKDLAHLGEDAQARVAGAPGAGAWGLVTQNYYMATYGNPVAMLGVATATEGMGATLAGGMAQVLAQRYGIPDKALTFLRSHAGFDQRHLREAQRAVNDYLRDEAEFEDVVQARRMTYRYYGQLFCDVGDAVPTDATSIDAPRAAA
ncbi:MAG TPA: iron-containing redox enzyme family protein [Solimonas sp.]